MEEVRFLCLLPLYSHTSQGRAARTMDSANPVHQAIPAPDPPLIAPPYMSLPPPGYYAQCTPHMPKPGDSTQSCPYFVAQVAPPDPTHINQQGENSNYHLPQTYYPIFHSPFPTQPVYPHSQGFITVRHNT